jgi:hypothetical protein
LLKNLLEISVAKLVTGLKLSVVLTVFLNGIVSQMYKSIINLSDVIFFATSTQIPFIIEISPQIFSLTVSYKQHIHSEVKFALIDQHRIHDVPLENEIAVGRSTMLVPIL